MFVMPAVGLWFRPTLGLTRAALDNSEASRPHTLTHRCPPYCRRTLAPHDDNRYH